MVIGGGRPLLELSGISKSFGGVTALRDVDFTLHAGEIHGLVGENGAGKSTLMKIIAGVHTDYGGTMRIDGQERNFRSARDALKAGIGMVHQELSIVPDLSVAENVFLGSQPVTRFGRVDWRLMNAQAAAHLRSLGIDVDPRVTIGSLPIGLQQMIEISRVLFSGARIIILDEPTSALSPPEIERLFGLLQALRQSGRSMIFISHFLDDILGVSDTVTIFRNGRKIVTAEAAGLRKSFLIEHMIGAGHEDLEESYTSELMLDSRPDAPVVLETSGLTLGRVFRDVSLTVRAGEVLGIYGFMGSGQLELARALFGKLHPEAGTVAIEGRTVALKGTAAARRAGVAFVPESRRSMLFSHEPVYKNMSISILGRLHPVLLRPAAEREIAERHVDQPRHPAAARRSASRHAVGRQPAESRAGEVADIPAESAGAERADARNGCRRQGRRGEDHPGASRSGYRHRRGVERAGNGAVPGRPNPCHEKGRSRPRVRE